MQTNSRSSWCVSCAGVPSGTFVRHSRLRRERRQPAVFGICRLRGEARLEQIGHHLPSPGPGLPVAFSLP